MGGQVGFGCAPPKRRAGQPGLGLNDHHRCSVPTVVGEAEVSGADAVVPAIPEGGGSEENLQFAERVLPDFHIQPEHRLSHAQSEGRYESLFCRKPQCQASDAVFSSGTKLPFEFGENPHLEPLAVYKTTLHDPLNS